MLNNQIGYSTVTEQSELISHEVSAGTDILVLNMEKTRTADKEEKNCVTLGHKS